MPEKAIWVQEQPAKESWPLILATLVGLTLLFWLSFFNRFAGLRSGDGEYSGGMAFLSGLLPYRDYFTAGPPLNALKSALLLKILGQALIVSRVAGVLERLLLGLVLLRWLVQLFRPWHALVAGVVTLVISTGDLTDPIASYNHDAILFAMLAGLAGSIALDGGSPRRVASLAMLAGASASLSLLTKQTVGLGILACVVTAGAILLAKIDGLRRAGIWCAGFAAGCAVPLALAAAWLWKNHLLGTFLNMLFVAGPSAKAGHSIDFLKRDFQIAMIYRQQFLLAVVALALSWRAIQRGLATKNATVPRWRTRAIWVGAGAAIIGTPEALAHTALPVLHNFSKTAIYFVLLGLTLWLAGQLSWFFRAGLTRRGAQAILFGAAAWSIAVMLSLSWPAFEAMTLPGLAFLLAATLDGVRDRHRWFPSLILAAMVFLQVWEKLDKPFGFALQDEPAVRFANATSVQPQLRGMRLPANVVSFLDDTVSTVAKETRPGDTIFTYPEMGLFYPLTGRQPPTFAGSHNIDVINDAFAREEAQRLTRARPAVIIYSRVPDSALLVEEWAYRKGKRSGQRDLIAAVEALVKDYRLAGTYVIAPGDPPISVYVRP